MKICNITVGEETHLALMTARGPIDATAAGYPGSMDELIAGAALAPRAKLAADESLPAVEAPVFANVVNRVGKLVCVGLNYRSHAA